MPALEESGVYRVADRGQRGVLLVIGGLRALQAVHRTVVPVRAASRGAALKVASMGLVALMEGNLVAEFKDKEPKWTR